MDTSQPYAEVIQEAQWSSNGAGVATSPTVMTRYDLGLDRLRLFQYQVNANAPPTSLASSWFVFDGLGSTRGLLDDGGVGVGEFGYVDAFGIPYQLAANGSRSVAGSGFFLNGQQWDGGVAWSSGEGLYFNRARYYQPGLGRFVAEDPEFGISSEPMGLHRYLYASNNPVNFVDPSGRETIASLMLGSSIASTLAQMKNAVDQQVFNIFKDSLLEGPEGAEANFYNNAAFEIEIASLAFMGESVLELENAFTNSMKTAKNARRLRALKVSLRAAVNDLSEAVKSGQIGKVFGHDTEAALEEISEIRKIMKLPSSGDVNDGFTIARFEIDGQVFFRMNGGDGYCINLVKKSSGKIKKFETTTNGAMNQSLFHAEIQLIVAALRKLGFDKLKASKVVSLVTDRPICGFCKNENSGVFALLSELGVGRIKVHEMGGDAFWWP